jgi:hypothetical protein
MTPWVDHCQKRYGQPMDCHCEDYDDEAIALRTKTSVRATTLFGASLAKKFEEKI